MTRCIIFDVDGTIFDTGEGIRYCARYSLDSLGARDFPDDKLNLFIGPSLYYSFRYIVGLGEEQAVRGVELYRSVYRSEGIDMSHPYEGIEELFIKLKNAGYVLTVASSKPLTMVQYLLSKYGYSRYFDKVVAADFDTVSSDKSDFVRAASLGESNVMVGDTHFDIEGAHKAGVKAIAAAYGFGSADTLVGAEYSASSPAEVYDAIQKIFSDN